MWLAERLKYGYARISRFSLSFFRLSAFVSHTLSIRQSCPESGTLWIVRPRARLAFHFQSRQVVRYGRSVMGRAKDFVLVPAVRDLSRQSS
jgi:hypothetical protein